MKNSNDPYAESFKMNQIDADYLFEVASEGELEQVMPVLENLIDIGKYIELVYSSNSVESKITKLIEKYPDQIRRKRLNLVYLEFFRKGLLTWASSKKIILCRYDFYPELFLLGLKKKHEFILISATLKGKKDKDISILKKFVYSQFTKIIYASPLDEKRFSFVDVDIPTTTFDFRVLQIAKRKELLKEKLENKLISSFYENIKNSCYVKKIIFGSYWDQESEVFTNKLFLQDIINKKIFVLLAPHNLDNETVHTNINSIKKILNEKQMDLSISIIKKDMSPLEIEILFKNLNEKPGIVLSLIPGVLVEFYELFDYAFVGGGHGRSVHSLLEPYFMNSFVLCGPKTHRSTEFDYIFSHSPENVAIVKELEQFYPIVCEKEHVDLREKKKRALMIESSKKKFNHIMKEFFGG